MATSQQIITDLEELSARGPLAVIGYFTALQTLGCIITPPWDFPVPAGIDLRPDQPKAGASRNRGMSKTAQAIMAVFVPEGMSKRDIVKKTGLPAKQVATALPTMQKNGYAYVKNSRWFAGPAPAKSAAGRPAVTAKTTPTTEAGANAPALGEATMQAIRNSAPGMTNADVQKYLADNGTPARPNHIGIALQRHKRAGRLELRDKKWYAPNVEELRQAG